MYQKKNPLSDNPFESYYNPTDNVNAYKTAKKITYSSEQNLNSLETVL